MHNRISIVELLEWKETLPVFDVRSPGEYKQAHIPGAHSFPLFTDEERKIIGTAYKQESREKAVRLGLDFFKEKMAPLIEKARDWQDENGGKIIVHCWRGGMRSATMAWLLDLAGYEVFILTGGYKTFRRWALEQLEKEYNLQVLGGYTGSGKSEMLQVLSEKGHAVLDLEQLARHKGSAFGNLDENPQPRQEMFENLLAYHLWKLSKDPSRKIWVEDESQRIGLINIPGTFFRNMRTQPIYFMDIPFEERLQHILSGYGNYNPEKLKAAILRIQKRLGGLETKTAVGFLEKQDIKNCFGVLLKYYDKCYKESLPKRENLADLLHIIPSSTTDPVRNSRLLENQLLN